jgi:hypothetical protein
VSAFDRASALLALVESDRERRTRETLEPARARARAELAEARRAARSRVATALAGERATFEARVAAAEARVATARRTSLQRRRKALVAEGWVRLAHAMRARWADPGTRRAWTGAALAAGLALLPRGRWRLEGPEGWSEADRAEALGRLAREGVEAECACLPRIETGIAITSGRVVLDATAEGLLAERAQVEGRMLRLLEETRT